MSITPKASDKRRLVKEAHKRKITYRQALEEWQAEVRQRNAVEALEDKEIRQEAALQRATEEESQKEAIRQYPLTMKEVIPRELKVPPFTRVKIYTLFREIPMECSTHAIEVMKAKAVEDPAAFVKTYGLELTKLLIQL